MESIKAPLERIPPHVPRLKLILGRFPLIEVREGLEGFVVTMKVENVSFIFPVKTHRVDIRPDDYATLYTELPLKEVLSAHSLPPPQQ